MAKIKLQGFFVGEFYPSVALTSLPVILGYQRNVMLLSRFCYMERF